MPRKKSYSSQIAHAYDTAIILAQEIKTLNETMADVFAKAESYKKLSPIINAMKEELSEEEDITIPETPIVQETKKKPERIKKNLKPEPGYNDNNTSEKT